MSEGQSYHLVTPLQQSPSSICFFTVRTLVSGVSLFFMFCRPKRASTSWSISVDRTRRTWGMLPNKLCWCLVSRRIRSIRLIGDWVRSRDTGAQRVGFLWVGKSVWGNNGSVCVCSLQVRRGSWPTDTLRHLCRKEFHVSSPLAAWPAPPSNATRTEYWYRHAHVNTLLQPLSIHTLKYTLSNRVQYTQMQRGCWLLHMHSLTLGWHLQLDTKSVN